MPRIFFPFSLWFEYRRQRRATGEQTQSCRFLPTMTFAKNGLIILLFLVTISIADSAALNFSWEAHVDNTKAVAYSKETSWIDLPPPSSYYERLVQRHRIQQASKDFVATWPLFICRGSVSFGLLRVYHNDAVSGSCRVHIRGMKVPLLSFGPTRQKRLDLSLGHWEIPLQNCWLALPDPKKCEKTFGHLRFRCLLQQATGTARNDRQPAAGNKNDRRTDCYCKYALESSLVEYRPRLLGIPKNHMLPYLHPMAQGRTWLYLHSQSLIHTYVVWRFHRAWRNFLISTASCGLQNE